LDFKSAPESALSLMVTKPPVTLTEAEMRQVSQHLRSVARKLSNKATTPLIQAMPISDFLSLELPPRKTLLEPWLLSQGLCMVHAYRSMGKTFFALGVACAVATGSNFLKWNASEPAGVLFVDGEMAACCLQDRLTATLAAMDLSSDKPPDLHIVTPDILSHGMPDLSTSAGQAALEAVITSDIRLIILDNLSCLCRTGQENKAESWLPVQEWCLKMRSQGRSILLVHHDGKTKEQRGTSRKEDLLDAVIQLTRPAGYHMEDGCVFEVHFRKARGLHGDDVKPFEAKLTLSPGNPAEWTFRDIEKSTREKVQKFLSEGWAQKEIAEELKISAGLVSRYAKT
jgi:putative DNA primase/helicase